MSISLVARLPGDSRRDSEQGKGMLELSGSEILPYIP